PDPAAAPRPAHETKPGFRRPNHPKQPSKHPLFLRRLQPVHSQPAPPDSHRIKSRALRVLPEYPVQQAHFLSQKSHFFKIPSHDHPHPPATNHRSHPELGLSARPAPLARHTIRRTRPCPL